MTCNRLNVNILNMKQFIYLLSSLHQGEACYQPLDFLLFNMRSTLLSTLDKLCFKTSIYVKPTHTHTTHTHFHTLTDTEVVTYLCVQTLQDDQRTGLQGRRRRISPAVTDW